MFKIADGRDFFYQWDIGRKLIVTDNTITEAHFCHPNNSTVYAVAVDDSSSTHTVEVPGELLQHYGTFKVYGHVHGVNNNEYTKSIEYFDIVPKPKPDNYNYEDAKGHWVRFQEEIDELNENITQQGNTLTGVQEDVASQQQDIEELMVQSNIHDKILDNLQAQLDPNIVFTDNTAAYKKSVPGSACPWAQVNSIGGVTRKCTNLIPYPYLAVSGSVHGNTCTIKSDGTITFSGTPTSAYTVVLCEKEFPAGNYYLSDGVTRDGLFFIAYDIAGLEVISYDGASFTLTSRKKVRIYYLINPSFNGTAVTVYPMLNSGTTALPYESYFKGLRSAPVTELMSEGKNIFGGIALANKIKAENSNANLSVTNKTISYKAADISNKVLFTDFKPNTQYTFIFKGIGGTDRFLNINIIYTDGSTATAWKFKTSNTLETFRVVSEASKSIKNLVGYYNSGQTTLYYDECGIFEGNVQVADFIPYKAPITFPIPEAVRPEHGINENVYDYIEWCEDGTKKLHKRVGKVIFDGVTRGAMMDSTDAQGSGKAHYYAYLWSTTLSVANNTKTIVNDPNVIVATVTVLSLSLSNEILGLGESPSTSDIVTAINRYLNNKYLEGNPVMVVYELVTPEVTDISDKLPTDNFIEVEGGGIIRVENTYKYNVPTSITYLLKEALT